MMEPIDRHSSSSSSSSSSSGDGGGGGGVSGDAKSNNYNNTDDSLVARLEQQNQLLALDTRAVTAICQSPCPTSRPVSEPLARKAKAASAPPGVCLPALGLDGKAQHDLIVAWSTFVAAWDSVALKQPKKLR
jgi:hypothetical protein